MGAFRSMSQNTVSVACLTTLSDKLRLRGWNCSTICALCRMEQEDANYLINFFILPRSIKVSLILY